MPPRLHTQSNKRLRLSCSNVRPSVCQCRWATIATTPAPSIDQMTSSAPPIVLHPPTQPPSYKPPHFRKSQLHRQYTSLLKSTPLILVFQHNNLKTAEWVGIRRQLAAALQKADNELASSSQDPVSPAGAGDNIAIQIIKTSIFASALKVVEYYRPRLPETANKTFSAPPNDPKAASSMNVPDTRRTPVLRHSLGKTAYKRAKVNAKTLHGLEPLLSGPLALLTFPTVSPAHVKAALSILAPSEKFPAPKRRANPEYYESDIQSGLQKLMLLGARVEGKAFDMEGTRWVASIDGGLDGLRAQLVAMLTSVGAGITHALDSARRSLYITMEGRRMMLEDEAKPKSAEEQQGPAP